MLQGMFNFKLASEQEADLFAQTILDCSEANEGFYVKCGFRRAGLEMAHYYEPKSSHV